MDDVVKGWLQFGVMGLVIIMLVYALVTLWSAYTQSQENRIKERSDDRKEAYDALTSVAEPLKKQDQTLNLILQIVQNIKGRR